MKIAIYGNYLAIGTFPSMCRAILHSDATKYDVDFILDNFRPSPELLNKQQFEGLTLKTETDADIHFLFTDNSRFHNLSNKKGIFVGLYDKSPITDVKKYNGIHYFLTTNYDEQKVLSKALDIDQKSIFYIKPPYNQYLSSISIKEKTIECPKIIYMSTQFDKRKNVDKLQAILEHRLAANPDYQFILKCVVRNGASSNVKNYFKELIRKYPNFTLISDEISQDEHLYNIKYSTYCFNCEVTHPTFDYSDSEASIIFGRNVLYNDSFLDKPYDLREIVKYDNQSVWYRNNILKVIDIIRKRQGL